MHKLILCGDHKHPFSVDFFSHVVADAAGQGAPIGEAISSERAQQGWVTRVVHRTFAPVLYLARTTSFVLCVVGRHSTLVHSVAGRRH